MEELIRNELDFYSKFARPLIINLPESKDRVLAAGWMKKIMTGDVDSVKLRTDYLKLLLFALQRQKLVGIFADDPSKYEKLEEFPEEFDLNEMAKKLIEREHTDRQDRIRRQLRGQEGDFPPYTTDFSSDFREYVAAQDIPGFGVHCYYAISKDPITSWRRVDKNILPKFAKSAVDTTTPVPAGVVTTSSDPSCICPTLGPEVKDKEEQCKVSRGKIEEPPRKKKPRKFGRQPPTHMLGKAAEPEEREPPNWGTNLVEVKDKPKPETGAVPKKKSALKVPRGEDTTLDEFEECVREFRQGELGVSPRKRRKRLGGLRGDESELADIAAPEYEGSPFQDMREAPGYAGTPFQEEAGALIPRDEYIPLDEEDPEALRRQQEIAEDEDVIEHFRRQLKQADTRQKISEVNERIESSLPAKSHMPVTTPRVSTSPRRLKSPEKIFQKTPPLPDPGELPDIPGADRDMTKLYMQVATAADMEAGGVIVTKKPEDKISLEEQQKIEERRRAMEAEQVERVEERADVGPPIQPGSTDANRIIADFESTKETRAPKPDSLFEDLQFLPLSPEKPGLESPPMWSARKKKREAARAVEQPIPAEGDMQWTHAPQYFDELRGEDVFPERDYEILKRRQLRPSELRRIPRPPEPPTPDSLFEDLQFLPLSPEKPGLESPPMLSARKKPREQLRTVEYPEPDMGDIQWTHAPQYFGEGRGEEVFPDRGYEVLKRRQLTAGELRQIPRPRELTQRQIKMMQDPRYRDQLFFEAEVIPEEIDEMYFVEQEQQQMRMDDFGLPLRVDIQSIPVRERAPDQPVVFPKFRPPAEIQLPPLEDVIEPEGDQLEPMGPGEDILGYITPEKLRPTIAYQESPSSDVDFSILPCDAECSPMKIHGGVPDLFALEEVPQELLPPSPPELIPLSPSPPPRRPFRPPDRERMAPQRLQFSGESPSILIAEPGSPKMLSEVSPLQVYGVEPLDVPFSPQEILDLEAYQAGDFLGPDFRMDEELSERVGMDVSQYLMGEPDVDLDIAQLEFPDDSEMLDVSPPRFPDVAETDHQEMMQRRQRVEDMLLYMPPKRPTPPKKEEKQPLTLSETEKQFLGFLYEGEPGMADVMIRVATAVADVEQDFPDPLHIMYPLYPAGEDTLFDEEFPEGEYGILEPSPETSPQAAVRPGEPPRGHPLAQPPHPPPERAGPSGIAEPSRPGPSRVPSPGRPPQQPSQLQPPGARPSGLKPPGAPRPSGLKPPGAPKPSGLRPPGGAKPSGLRPPGGAKPSGLRPPGGAKPSGLKPPGAPRPSGLKPPGGVRPPGIPVAGAIPQAAAPPLPQPAPPRQPSPVQAPCAPCSQEGEVRRRSPPREPPIITITEATPEWLARGTDADLFAEQFVDTGGYEMLEVSPPRSFEEALYRSPTPERLPSPPAYTGFDLLPEQVQQQQGRDVDLVGESPPGAVGGYEPCQPCQRGAFSHDLGIEPLSVIMEEPRPVLHDWHADEIRRERFVRAMRDSRLGFDGDGPVDTPFGRMPAPVRRGRMDEAYVEDIPDQTVPSPPRAPHLLDSPVPESVPQAIDVRDIAGWTTPPHQKNLRYVQRPEPELAEQPRRVQRPIQEMPFYRILAQEDILSHQFQLQHQQAQIDQDLSQELEDVQLEDVQLFDDMDLPEYASPVKPCEPCRARVPTPPSPPSPPGRTPSPRAADIFREAGIHISPQTYEPSYSSSYDPNWLRERYPSGSRSGSPERVERESSTSRRYVMSQSPRRS